MAIVIRNANADDLPAAQGVSDAAFAQLRDIYRPTADAIENKPADEKLMRLVAEVDKTIVGTLLYQIEGQNVQLIGLAVDPKFQRRGVARALINHLTGHTTSQCSQISTLTLNTIRETGNVTLFGILGFRIVGEQPADWCISDKHDQLHEVTMKREVSSAS